MRSVIRYGTCGLVAAAMLGASAGKADSQPKGASSGPATAAILPMTYADLADLTDGTEVVVKVQPAKVTRLDPAKIDRTKVDPARLRGIRPGWGRFVVEAKAEALLTGLVPPKVTLRYAVDMPLDAKGKPVQIKKKSMVLFARNVRTRPGELQLVAPDAQLFWDAALETRLNGLIDELDAPGAPFKITGVREAIHVSGDLAGEGETQIFLQTAVGEPAAITVTRRHEGPPSWGVSFSELVATDNAPPRDTLAWYRLACALAAQLPVAANISEREEDRQKAAEDYAFVRRELGACQRNRS